jgi:hypothetical protein
MSGPIGMPHPNFEDAKTSRLRKKANEGISLRNDGLQGALPLDPIKGKPMKSFS